MSGTSYRLVFVAVANDTYHWTAEHLAQAEAAGATDYQEWAANQVEAVMRAAGNAFIAAHPDMFRLDEII